MQETVLIVEDEVLVRMAIARHLRDCDYRVNAAFSADETLTAPAASRARLHPPRKARSS
jgi:CheY-like chemotaxis protein